MRIKKGGSLSISAEAIWDRASNLLVELGLGIGVSSMFLLDSFSLSDDELDALVTLFCSKKDVGVF